MDFSNKESFQISVAGPDRIDVVLKQWQQLTSYLPIHHAKPFGLPIPEHLENQLRHTLEQCIERDDAMVFIAEGDKVCGTIAVILNQQTGYTQPNSSVLFNLWVEPDLRRKGIGQALVVEAKQWLKAQGVTSVQAGWHPGNPEADDFWLKQGFSPYETIGSAFL
ncbi:GNAT family N-acetyltransferase [Neptuniibacter sp. QD48_55]|uniref:GNAT family N-acetyltransferase n=1 Tax=Neptuniibacter sp. QD48_55 TaxID=3398212 RepID=UPI0039F5B44F